MDRAIRKERIEALIAKWQAKLRLPEWWIYFAEDEEPDGGALGSAETNVDGLTSTLRISSRLFEQEEEITVVHELLEVMFRVFLSLSNKDDQDAEKHRIMQRLIWALLGIHDFEPTKFVARKAAAQD